MRGFKMVILLICIFGFCQSQAQTDALKYADSISKTTGMSYLNMFGTKVFIPKGKQRSAVRRDIHVLEIFNDSAQVVAEIKVLQMPAYTTLQQPGSGFTPFNIKGAAGRLYKTGNSEGNVLTFLSEDDESKLLIQVSFIDLAAEQEYLELLKNIYYEKNVKIHTRLLPLLARFTVNAASAGYQLIDVSKGSYRYTPNGVRPKSANEPQVWITEHHTTDMSELRYLDLPALPGGVITIDSIAKKVEEPTIDGFKVYTSVIYIGVAPNRLMVYQAARTNGVVSAVITGIATSEFEKNKTLFEKMANALHVRGGHEIKLFEN